MTTSAPIRVVEQLYLRHDPALRRFLGRVLRCEEAAAEVAQEVWARLIRFLAHPGREPVINEPRAYLFQMASNLARDRLARERRRPPMADADEVEVEAVAGITPDPEAEALVSERLRSLAEAVDRLPPRCRQVFLLSRLDGLGNAEIAERLGISRNMVEKHIIRAMLHCRRHLDAAGQ